MPDRADEFQPGDVTVTPVSDGFMLGRVIPEQQVGGPWWTLLRIVSGKGTAIAQAVAAAAAGNHRIWYSEDAGRYTSLDPDQLWLGTTREWCLHDAAMIHEKVPALPGVYIIRAETPLLIGHTDDLKQRLLYHQSEIYGCEAARDAALEFCFEVVLPAAEREDRAVSLIAWWSPPCNDGVSVLRVPAPLL